LPASSEAARSASLSNNKYTWSFVKLLLTVDLIYLIYLSAELPSSARSLGSDQPALQGSGRSRAKAEAFFGLLMAEQ
jgi:hypothetical protein